MLTIYGSEMCPDCINCKYNFDKFNIEYEFIDINKSLRDLSTFLQMRDNNPIFDHCKEINDIGLPAIIKEDGEVFLNWEGYLKDLGFNDIDEVSNLHTSCNLNGDRKGC